LEWQTPSPPPTDNFEQTPIVTREPYDYDRGEPQAEYAPGVTQHG
jgi:cytochrome c oxidase subunit 1